MAYFPNGTSGMAFDEQCSQCKLYEYKIECPIYCVQVTYNYDAVNNKVATEILDELVKDCGRCLMFEAYEKLLEKVAQEKEEKWLNLE